MVLDSDESRKYLAGVSTDLRNPHVAGPLGTLAISQVKPHSSTASLRAIKWHEDLRRLGMDLPFAVVHDFGMVLVTGPQQIELGPRVDWSGSDAALAKECRRYLELLTEAHACEAARRAPQLQMSDDLVVVVLARILQDVSRTLRARPAYDARLPLDGSLFERLRENTLIQLYRSVDRSFEREAIMAITAARLLILTLADALDLDTLRLFGMVGLSEGGALAQVDLLAASRRRRRTTWSTSRSRSCRACSRPRPRRRASTIAAFGYSGLGTTRLASTTWCSPSWLGTTSSWCAAWSTTRSCTTRASKSATRQAASTTCWSTRRPRCAATAPTFARGMAIATGKKLLLEGEDVVFRFFDSRLYEPHARATAPSSPRRYLLSFKGEHGRNPARVFAELVTELESSRRAIARPPVVHLFTHAALYIPREMVQAVTRLAQPRARCSSCPRAASSTSTTSTLLDAHWVVDHAMLGRGGASARTGARHPGRVHRSRPATEDGDAPRSARGAMVSTGHEPRST